MEKFCKHFQGTSYIFFEVEKNFFFKFLYSLSTLEREIWLRKGNCECQIKFWDDNDNSPLTTGYKFHISHFLKLFCSFLWSSFQSILHTIRQYSNDAFHSTQVSLDVQKKHISHRPLTMSLDERRRLRCYVVCANSFHSLESNFVPKRRREFIKNILHNEYISFEYLKLFWNVN